ncbi:phosphate transport system permease protein [Catellatospora sp. IY07-71]|uniref:phosphate ABC transporter permease subunit PstC n=1 Tax=Catellatospora sp. IY07-71 TaxID=2728827 RepID=UPI001BB3C081|nr:phosphate ABC transporter permease subunit PstC [Catellatospora sp. IY07-71]BCJ71375.1 phosphate transport system permease protein [Catellatospora sp. IY07-71]
MTVLDKSAQLTRKDRGRHADRLFWAVCVFAGLAVLIILALILVTTVNEAFPAFSADFFTSTEWIPNDPDGDGPRGPVYGTLAFLYGTLVVSAIAVVVAVPVSIGIALFLTELAPPKLRATIVTLIDMLAAVPSVVFGLWGILVLAPAIVPVYQGIHDVVGGVPGLGSLFGEPRSSGRTFMTAGLILAVMIIPIITSISREVFATVPDSDKQAAWALGATRWEMIKGAVLPHSFGGVVGAVILGLGRAMGETIAVALVIGSSVQITANLFESGYALPAIIVDQWGESTGDFRAALIGMGVVLFIITVLINLLARVVVRRAEIRMKGAAA